MHGFRLLGEYTGEGTQNDSMPDDSMLDDSMLDDSMLDDSMLDDSMLDDSMLDDKTLNTIIILLAHPCNKFFFACRVHNRIILFLFTNSRCWSRAIIMPRIHFKMIIKFG